MMIVGYGNLRTALATAGICCSSSAPHGTSAMMSSTTSYANLFLVVPQCS
jgi:hypothetical protein